jgi:hypothetical protein
MSEYRAVIEGSGLMDCETVSINLSVLILYHTIPFLLYLCPGFYAMGHRGRESNAPNYFTSCVLLLNVPSSQIWRVLKCFITARPSNEERLLCSFLCKHNHCRSMMIMTHRERVDIIVIFYVVTIRR